MQARSQARYLNASRSAARGGAARKVEVMRDCAITTHSSRPAATAN